MKKLNPALLKSIYRGGFIALNAIISASQTYAAQGHTLGLNMPTVIGVSWTLASVGLAVAQRYLDKTDPAFGKVTAPLTAAAKRKIASKTK